MRTRAAPQESVIVKILGDSIVNYGGVRYDKAIKLARMQDGRLPTFDEFTKALENPAFFSEAKGSGYWLNDASDKKSVLFVYVPQNETYDRYELVAVKLDKFHSNFQLGHVAVVQEKNGRRIGLAGLGLLKNLARHSHKGAEAA